MYLRFQFVFQWNHFVAVVIQVALGGLLGTWLFAADKPPRSAIPADKASVEPRLSLRGDGLLQRMGPTDRCLDVRLVNQITTDISIKADGSERPEDIGSVCRPSQVEPGSAMPFREWQPLGYCWEAPSLCHGPLYFEETNLERFGYSQKGLRAIQPLASTARFFGTVPMLPYLLLAEPSRDCVYTLGQYRPGSCVPFQWNYPYFSPCEPCHKDDK
jgi:hypothetical protein